MADPRPYKKGVFLTAEQRTRLRVVLDLMDEEGERAQALQGHVPGDPEVLALCERVGFGAVIDSAARQWWLRDPLGAHLSGPCAGTMLHLRKILGMRRPKAAGPTEEQSNG